MFWKKRRKIDFLMPEDDRDCRSAFRIKPDTTRPIILTVAGNSYPVVNISGTGCCFHSHSFPDGYQASGTMRIPSEDLIFPISIKVVGKQRDICHCEFVKIDEKSEEAIHSYVLEVQKKSIRK